MADSNNNLAGQIPAAPYPALKQLSRLVGTWEITGTFLTGTTEFAWMEGGFFLVQKIDARHGDDRVRGIEYIGFDEDTATLRSMFFDTRGSKFAYTWALDGDTIRTWFGDRTSDNFYVGKFNEDGSSFSGEWQWPGGGYASTMTKQG